MANVGRASAQVVVRFAGDDEFPTKRTAPEEHLSSTGCDFRGAPTPAYYRPVVAFAREHMIGRRARAVHELLVGPNSAPVKLRDGTNIVVDPRGAVGELRIIAVGPPFYGPGDKWAETLYCLHVLDQGTTITIAVEQQWESIR
jgi:hypothetical protein